MSSIFNDIYALGQRYAPAPLPSKPAPRQAAPPPYPGYLSPADRQAQADQQTHTLYDPVLGVYRQQQQRQQLMELAQQAGLAKLYDVLGGSLAGFSGQVQGVYDQAGSALTGSNYDQGYQHGAQIAAQGLQGQGAGFANAAGALPAISGQQGAVKYLTAVQQAHADDQKLQDLIDSTAAEMPGKTQEFLYGINRDQTGLQNSYASYQLKQADLAAKNGHAALAQAWKVADTFTKKSDHVYVAVQGKNGVQVIDAGPASGPQMTPYQTASLKQRAQAQANTVRHQKAVEGKPSYTGSPYYPDPVTGQPTLKPGYHVDRKTNAVVKDPAAAKAGKAPTPNQLNTMVDTWYGGGKQGSSRYQPVDKKGNPLVDAQGNPVYRTEPGGKTGKLNYQQAYRRLRAYRLTDQQARSLLDTRWTRGDAGRPWLSAPESAALRQSRLYPRANFLSKKQAQAIIQLMPGADPHSLGSAYLDEGQVIALQKAGLLPAGEWVPGGGIRNKQGFSLVRVYLIRPGH